MKREYIIKRTLNILALKLAINQIYKDSIFNGHYFSTVAITTDNREILDVIDVMAEAEKEDKWLLDEMKLLDNYIK